MRGRLIQKMVLVLRKLDISETANSPGFDKQFRAPNRVRDGSQMGLSGRKEQEELRIPCQLDRRVWGALELFTSGKEDETDIMIVLYMPDLENMGLRDPVTGTVDISSGDRIERIEDKAGGVQWDFSAPPGLWVTGVQPIGYGLNYAGTPKINLCELRCSAKRMAGR